MITEMERCRARMLRAAGYQQTSRKYRHVARIPAGLTAIEAVRRHDPRQAERFLQMAEEWAASHYRTYYAERDGCHETLSEGEFAAFREAGGHPSTRRGAPACSQTRTRRSRSAEACAKVGDGYHSWHVTPFELDAVEPKSVHVAQLPAADAMARHFSRRQGRT